MNQNWPRWIHASISKWISDNKGSYSFYFQGDDVDSGQESLWAIVQISGPREVELSNNIFELHVDVHLVVSYIVQPDDIYKLQRLCGYISSILTKEIAVYKHGDGGAHWGCLVRDENGVEIVDFNQSIKNVKLLQSEVRSHYVLTYTGE